MTKIQNIAIVVGIGTPLVAALSLYTTGICACLPVAQIALHPRSFDVFGIDEATLQQRVEARYPQGMSEADVRKRIGDTSYGKYCRSTGLESPVVCLLPYDANFWRQRGVEISFAMDGARNLKSVAVTRRIRYSWE